MFHIFQLAQPTLIEVPSDYNVENRGLRHPASLKQRPPAADVDGSSISEYIWHPV